VIPAPRGTRLLKIEVERRLTERAKRAIADGARNPPALAGRARQRASRVSD